VFDVSRVPFEKINEALVATKQRFLMPADVRNPLEEPSRMAEATVLAPVVTGLGALAAAVGTAWKLTRRETAGSAQAVSQALPIGGDRSDGEAEP
jgi:hypothetical protein